MWRTICPAEVTTDRRKSRSGLFRAPTQAFTAAPRCPCQLRWEGVVRRALLRQPWPFLSPGPAPGPEAQAVTDQQHRPVGPTSVVLAASHPQGAFTCPSTPCPGCPCRGSPGPCEVGRTWRGQSAARAPWPRPPGLSSSARGCVSSSGRRGPPGSCCSQPEHRRPWHPGPAAAPLHRCQPAGAGRPPRCGGPGDGAGPAGSPWRAAAWGHWWESGGTRSRLSWTVSFCLTRMRQRGQEKVTHRNINGQRPQLRRALKAMSMDKICADAARNDPGHSRRWISKLS